jgi:hypothetical protein
MASLFVYLKTEVYHQFFVVDQKKMAFIIKYSYFVRYTLATDIQQSTFFNPYVSS